MIAARDRLWGKVIPGSAAQQWLGSSKSLYPLYRLVAPRQQLPLRGAEVADATHSPLLIFEACTASHAGRLFSGSNRKEQPSAAAGGCRRHSWAPVRVANIGVPSAKITATEPATPFHVRPRIIRADGRLWARSIIR